jgi:two-component system, cell cycle response regulator DivK
VMADGVQPFAATRVLVVDDNAINLELAAAMLRASGIEVLTASDAEAGLALARTERPDIVLMDVQMPRLDGLEATRRLKADPATAAIPVLAFTAFAMTGDEARFIAAGCDGCITKPIELATFAAQVLAYLVPKMRSPASPSPGTM